MKCLFCGKKLIDTTSSMHISVSKYCEFSFYRYNFLLRYYVCVNKRIAIVNLGWINRVKRYFFTEGTFILYEASKHEEFEIDHRPLLKRGFIF